MYHFLKLKIMNLMSSKTHGVIDYIYGIILIASPWLFNFATGGPAMWVPIIVGIAVILMSMMTDFEVGAVKVIPMNVHLWVDGLIGAFLILSPWIFGFREFVMWPHIIFGIIAVGSALVTETHPTHKVAH
jgi:hypothetical protein